MNILRDKTNRIIQKIADSYPAVIGIQASRPSRPEETFSINSEESFPTASIIKIPILIEFYRQVEIGSLNKNEIRRLTANDKVGGSGILRFLSDEKTSITLEDYARLMINLSDNTATNIIIDKVGIDNVNHLLKLLGLEETRLLRKMQAKDVDPEVYENLSTPKELTSLMLKLMMSQGVCNNVTEASLEVLKLYKPGVIRDVIGEDVPLANKSGWMGGVECDTGIVYLPNPYIVTIMAKNIPAWDKGSLVAKEILREMISELHNYYMNTGASTQHGRLI
jgi:beta-lactamase class A